MNSQNNNNDGELGFLFNVEILVKDETNAKALQSLLHLLNNANNIIDYRINSGIELGEIIESLLKAKKQSLISKSYKRLKANNEAKNPSEDIVSKTEQPAPPPPAPASQSNKKSAAQSNTEPNSFKEIAQSKDFQDWIQKYISGNRLVRIVIKKGEERISIPCRILNFLPETYNLTVYHVDEKQVYTFKLSEIVDFIDK
ncbi:hypothetical protein FHR92_001530 [Fontibacillus solani]|uniref:Uncharacterized protein n=2 Tax=Fontibacillus TaxID=995014 RepID=A0A1G7KFI8_9BACL|nr:MULTISPECIES: hypothetical protein [Fontibacillus]MBA9085068.1 hypothetical protein [Fontibacillus solani]SDF36058.1 hypothetical protein SAMN04488542_109129 [Fontibacillus panacisegetis]